MSLNTRAFALAAGMTAALLFTVCAVGVAIAPGVTTSIASTLIHMDLSGMVRTLTIGSFVGGLFGWTIGTALTFGFAAWVYNRLIK